MIRANLLPRRRETVSAFSLEIELGFLKEIALALAIVLLVTLIGSAIERWRIDRLANAATDLEARVAANATRREESRRLMVDVARYQEFEREAAEYRRSGSTVAIDVARIGNSVPANVWVDEISRVDRGYAIAGGSRSVDSLAGAIAALGRARPGDRASLLSITNRDQTGAGVRFSARILPPTLPTTEPFVSRSVTAR